MKKLICFLLASVISMSAFAVISVSAYDEQDTAITYIVQPRYAYTSSIRTDLYINGSKATCTSTINGMPNVTKIVATQYLEKSVNGSWQVVTLWNKTSYSDTLYMSNSKSDLESGTYRLRTYAYVYCGTDYEIVEDTSK